MTIANPLVDEVITYLREAWHMPDSAIVRISSKLLQYGKRKDRQWWINILEEIDW